MSEAMTYSTFPVPIPPSEWGKDHWGVLLYLETCCVDKRGIPDFRRIQCNENRHPWYYAGQPGKNWPIRLTNNRQIVEYDEWDCIKDLEFYGFVQSIGSTTNPQFLMGDLGHKMVGVLRKHLASSTYKYFIFDESVLD